MTTAEPSGVIWCPCGRPHTPGECRLPSVIVKSIRYKDWVFSVAPDESWLRVMFVDKEKVWKGRKWKLSPHMLRSELVQTALMAVLAAEEHEAREKFLYKDYPIFGPHYNVEDLVKLCYNSGQQIRPEPKEEESV